MAVEPAWRYLQDYCSLICRQQLILCRCCMLLMVWSLPIGAYHTRPQTCPETFNLTEQSRNRIRRKIMHLLRVGDQLSKGCCRDYVTLFLTSSQFSLFPLVLCNLSVSLIQNWISHRQPASVTPQKPRYLTAVRAATEVPPRIDVPAGAAKYINSNNVIAAT
jgi:hypothetical protein